MDDELKKYGAGIALCAFFVLFVGSTFTIWGITAEGEIDDVGKSNYEFKFSIDEGESGFDYKYAQSFKDDYDVTDESENGDLEYDDLPCNCDELESFFGNLKLLFYGLLISGCAMAYIGHTGEKTEYTEKAIGAAALFSVIIVAYTFISLPNAFEEDFEHHAAFDDLDLPGFYGTEKDTIEESEDDYQTEIEFKAKPGLGYIAGVVSLGLAGYLIRERGITLEDITG